MGKFIKLKTMCSISENNTEIIVTNNSSRKYFIFLKDNPNNHLVLKLFSSILKHEVVEKEFFFSQYGESNRFEYDNMLSELLAIGVIEISNQSKIDFGKDRFSTQKLYLSQYSQDVEALQDKLENLRIAVIGAGSLGSSLCVKLSAMGIKKIYCVDEDIVELDNLTRQIYYTPQQVDEECEKVVALDKFIKNFYPESEFIGIRKYVTSSELGASIPNHLDLIINTADSPQGKIDRWVNEFSVKNKIPAIYSHHKSVGPLYLPKDDVGCFLCFERYLDNISGNIFSKIVNVSNNQPNSKSPSFVTGELLNEHFILKIIVNLFIKENTKSMENMVTTFYNDSLDLERIVFKKESDCFCQNFVEK